jgi:N-acetyl-anhydromuramyl-L-alanine amidase AmpD
MRVKPARLVHKLKAHKVNFTLVPGWKSARIDPYNGTSDFKGVLLHHTAGINSLNYIVNTNPYAPVRACHFLVQRDGKVQVVSGVGAYHAGKGGAYKFNRFVTIPKDQGNRYLYGIEIESMGTTAIIGNGQGAINIDQVVSTALLTAALLNAMRPGWRSLPVSRVIRHADWTTRKVDPRQDLDWWHQVVGIARRARRDGAKAEREIRAFVRAHPKGVL